MKKLSVSAAVAASLALMFPAAHAATSSQQFGVDITLTPVCTLTTPGNVVFAYTSFGGAATATGGGFTATCTNGLVYTLGLQAGTAAATPPGTATISVTDDATNLAYTLGLSPATAAGTGSSQLYSVTGSMAASQGGTCAAGPTCSNASATNKTHTVILSF